MSWSSDCVEYCQDVRKRLRNGERVDKLILDSNLMILEALSGIADMMEKIGLEQKEVKDE